ncbi:MAG TPA: (deoxy)nucleoside triphosphate pyrophosphohydrolase [Mycobacteriales bacterium]|nr:(deoxy)nucleoside triphosphate pyrophosphohydrolase [Mycobacteriales bacterium]
MTTPPDIERRVVVGAAILDREPPGARVLVVQRGAPPQLAGLWEFPGGKVEPGETEAEALVRECREELGLTLVVGERIGGDARTVDGTMTLRVYLASVESGELALSEHVASAWLDASRLGSVPWIPTDLPVVDALRRLLR